ncbi:predicted protein [Chaetoceros tenuissimus]|uniref:Uncharacterized protein n=1 Tax=Chaetoceros tenuissimus TaxID=426638 RepID=A0AAD3CHZ6_9STRA|nr:predicted protein [Chaetoceros tenuissimus]
MQTRFLFIIIALQLMSFIEARSYLDDIIARNDDVYHTGVLNEIDDDGDTSSYREVVSSTGGEENAEYYDISVGGIEVEEHNDVTNEYGKIEPESPDIVVIGTSTKSPSLNKSKWSILALVPLGLGGMSYFLYHRFQKKDQIDNIQDERHRREIENAEDLESASTLATFTAL